MSGLLKTVLHQKSRVVVAHDENLLKFIIPARQEWYLLPFYLVALVIQLTIGGSILFFLSIYVVQAYQYPQYALGPLLVMTMCLVPGLIFWLGISNLFLWQVAGKEVIEVTRQGITIVRHVLWWKTIKEYPAMDVYRLRLYPMGWNPIMVFWRLFQALLGRSGMIVFDYQGREYRFGTNISDMDARQILATIQEGFVQYQ